MFSVKGPLAFTHERHSDKFKEPADHSRSPSTVNPLKHQLLTVLVIFLSISIIFAIPRSGDTLRAHAQTVEPPRLEVWSPDVHSSNITDPNPLPIPSIFPPGKHITVLLNLTGGGPVASFDISLNYNISSGPNVLQLL